MGSKKIAVLMLAILVILILFAQSTKQGFAVSDQFERARVAGEIVTEETFPQYNNIYGIELMNTYPPLFDVQSAVGRILTGLDFVFQWRILALVITICLFVFSYKLSRIYIREEYALISGFFAVLLPWVFRRAAFPIAESLGLAFFVILLYGLIKKESKILAIILPIIALTHMRSFFTFLPIFLILGVYYLVRKEIELKKFVLPLISLALFAGFWYVGIFPAFQFSPFTNPWVDIFPLTQIFSFLWIFALLSAFVLLFLKRHNFFVWIFIAGVLFAILFGNTIFGFRELAYLFFPVAFLSAYLLQIIEERINLFPSILLLIVMISFPLLSNFDWINQKSYFSEQNIEAVKALDNFEVQTVQGDFLLSYTVPLYSAKKIIIGPFMESLEGGRERAESSFEYYKNCDFSDATEFRPDLVFITPLVLDSFDCSEEKFEGKEYAKLLDSGSIQIFSIG